MIPTANQAGHRLHDSVDILAIDEIATSSTGRGQSRPQLECGKGQRDW